MKIEQSTFRSCLALLSTSVALLVGTIEFAAAQTIQIVAFGDRLTAGVGRVLAA
jgi:hypothetical protein